MIARTTPPEISGAHVEASSLMIRIGSFLRLGEIRGLCWDDDELSILNIRRSVWRSIVLDETKNHEDEKTLASCLSFSPSVSCLIKFVRESERVGFSGTRSEEHLTSTISLTG